LAAALVSINELPAMSAFGPKLRFAAAQGYDRCRWKSGRSMDVTGTAGFDPEQTSLRSAIRSEQALFCVPISHICYRRSMILLFYTKSESRSPRER
jgi:hypothetical protein